MRKLRFEVFNGYLMVIFETVQKRNYVINYLNACLLMKPLRHKAIKHNLKI